MDTKTKTNTEPLASFFEKRGNNAEQDQMQQNAVSDQGLHYFRSYKMVYQNLHRNEKKYRPTALKLKWTCPINKGRKVHSA